MNVDITIWIGGVICGAGGVLVGGAFWFGRHVSGVESAITTLTNGLDTLVNTVKDIGDELKKRDETFWKEFEKRDAKYDALGRRHDELKERVVIIEHEMRK